MYSEFEQGHILQSELDDHYQAPPFAMITFENPALLDCAVSDPAAVGLLALTEAHVATAVASSKKISSY